MLKLVNSVTLHDANGRLWDKSRGAPKSGVDGLVTVIQTPSSNVSSTVRNVSFSVVAYEARALHMAAVTCAGDTFIFNIQQNRYLKVDKTGYEGTAAAFSSVSIRQLFVGYAVSDSPGSSSTLSLASISNPA